MFLSRRDPALEIMDRGNFTRAELDGNLSDLEMYNRLAGGLAAVRGPLAALAAGERPRGPLRVLDVGTGAAGLAEDLASTGIAGRRLLVLGVDLSLEMLSAARRLRGTARRTRLCASDAARLPLPDGVVDLAWSSLLLHHLDDRSIAGSLAEMKRVTRMGFVVSDLRRSLTALAAVWAVTRLTSRNRLTLHDGPLSVRRALRPGELGRLAGEAGLLPARSPGGAGYRIRRRGPARLELTYRHVR